MATRRRRCCQATGTLWTRGYRSRWWGCGRWPRRRRLQWPTGQTGGAQAAYHAPTAVAAQSGWKITAQPRAAAAQDGASRAPEGEDSTGPAGCHPCGWPTAGEHPPVGALPPARLAVVGRAAAAAEDMATQRHPSSPQGRAGMTGAPPGGSGGRRPGHQPGATRRGRGWRRGAGHAWRRERAVADGRAARPPRRSGRRLIDELAEKGTACCSMRSNCIGMEGSLVETSEDKVAPPPAES